jgi:sugar phosphate isomerase/epimerase
MKLGFPNHPRKNIFKEIEWVGENGFDFVDLFLEEDRATPEKIDIEKIKKLLNKYGLDVVGHIAWYLPIGSPSQSYREFAVSEAGKYFDVFSKLSVQYATVHANWPPKLFTGEEGISFQVETLTKLVHDAMQYNIKIVYEPLDTWRDDIENVDEILRRVSGLFLHLDTGHANLFGRKPEQFIEKFHKQIRHIHLNDNDGIRDLHLHMGGGNIDWENLIRVLKKYYDSTITLEIFSQDRNFVLMSRDKLQSLWKK